MSQSALSFEQGWDVLKVPSLKPVEDLTSVLELASTAQVEHLEVGQALLESHDSVVEPEGTLELHLPDTVLSSNYVLAKYLHLLHQLLPFTSTFQELSEHSTCLAPELLAQNTNKSQPPSRLLLQPVRHASTVPPLEDTLVPDLALDGNHHG